MAVRIITDSASDFPQDKATIRRVYKVPMGIQFGNASYFDGKNIDADVFYRLLTTSEHHPTTSQPTPDAFLTEFEAAAKAGDSVVCFLVSGKLSGTYQSAYIAKQMCGWEEIYLVDTETVTAGMQILINHACKLRDSGLDASGIAHAVEELKSRIRIFAVIDTLEYLRRGGRISNAAAAIGTVSRLKPLIGVSDGKVSIVSKSFGTAAATKALFKQLHAHPVDDSFPSYFLYTTDLSKKEELIPMLREEKLLPSRLHDSRVGATIGVHVGPGGFGIAYLEKR